MSPISGYVKKFGTTRHDIWSLENHFKQIPDNELAILLQLDIIQNFPNVKKLINDEYKRRSDAWNKGKRATMEEPSITTPTQVRGGELITIILVIVLLIIFSFLFI
jgi:hypothetical protein